MCLSLWAHTGSFNWWRHQVHNWNVHSRARFNVDRVIDLHTIGVCVHYRSKNQNKKKKVRFSIVAAPMLTHPNIDHSTLNKRLLKALKSEQAHTLRAHKQHAARPAHQTRAASKNYLQSSPLLFCFTCVCFSRQIKIPNYTTNQYSEYNMVVFPLSLTDFNSQFEAAGKNAVHKHHITK